MDYKVVDEKVECQCEHEQHENSARIHGFQRYATRIIKTDYGTYKICTDCYDAGHMQVPDDLLEN